MKDILQLPLSEMKKHIKVLADDYLEKYGRRVCLSCGADVNSMINTLRKHYNMTNFELNKLNGIYKIEKGGKETISNKVMSDELALRFLSINRERISLFKSYPENWEEMLDGAKAEVELIDLEIPEQDDEVETLRAQLNQYKMQELREMYPDIKSTSKDDFITQILNEE